MTRRLLVAALVLLPNLGTAQKTTMSFGGFVDTYLAWDPGKPPTIDRAYTTQAARSGEFNVNLAFIDAILAGDRVRGRIALQAGTSVEANYFSEPTTGRYSGASLAQHLQEAYVGARLSKTAWIDAGIFLSHTGSENWVSRDNPTYTRSLIADFAPYYESGAKVTWQVRPDLTALVTVVNGWQKISENNADKSFGMRLEWSVSPHISLGYYNLIGNDEPDTASAQVRFYNGLTVKWSSNEWTVMATVDGGRQDTPDKKPPSWWGGALIARAQTTEHTGFSARVETFSDPKQVLVATGVTSPFRAIGASIGFDFTMSEGAVWRTEYRALRSPDDIFIDRGGPAGRSRSNMLIVTSLAVTF